MERPTLESLILASPHVDKSIIYKNAQAGAPQQGAPVDVGQSPVVGNPDEMQVPESANQKQYEDDFGQLAYQFVQDRAPALIPYMIGFEVVERNDDGSKAVGIFGYKVDKDFYYIPCFFLNNQVRGVDMILNKKTNQFVPLTEKWIDFIVNKHSVSIGVPADDRVRDGMRNPDLSFVRRPQVALGKIAEDESPWSFRDAWGHMKEATARMAGDELFREMLVGVSESVRGDIEKSAESKCIKGFMEEHGGPEAMLSFINTMKDVGFANAAFTLYKDAEAFSTTNLKNATFHVERMKKSARVIPSIRIVDTVEGIRKIAADEPKSNVGEGDAELTPDEDARQIVEHDFTIEDVRPSEETAKVTDDEELVDVEHRFNPPDDPGEYNFMMADGKVMKGVLLNNMFSGRSCSKNKPLVCFDGEDGVVLSTADRNFIMTTEFGSVEDRNAEKDVLKDLYNKAKKISDIDIDKSSGTITPYLFIDEKGNSIGPFGIEFVISDGDHVKLKTCQKDGMVVESHASKQLSTRYGFMDWDISDRFHDDLGKQTKNYYDPEFGDPVDILSIGTIPGKPKKTPSGVIIPPGWKALKVTMVPDNWVDYDNGGDYQKRQHDANVKRDKFVTKYTLASAGDVLENMAGQGIMRVKVASDGSGYYVSADGAKRINGPMSYKEASIDLVAKFGFRPRRAFDTLRKAAASGKKGVRLLVKVPCIQKSAQDGLVNVSMPAPAEQIPSIDPYSGVPIYESPYIDITHGSYTGVPSLPPEGGMTRGINIGGEMERNMGGQAVGDEHTDAFGDGSLPIDEETRRLAEEAAAAGQRHVFDQAAIGGLARVYDTANVVDSYIPEFMDTIDRLGRILFLFYWKHEDFNQRYGSDDVVQMEDRLRNVFKQLGELTLQLKEKSVQKE